MPVLPGTQGADRASQQAQAFLAALGTGGGVMVKAVAGGGGRGMRPVTSLAGSAGRLRALPLRGAAAFGNGDVYVEQLFPRARHIEVQIVGDGTGAVSHLWERECRLQRQRQKLVEIAPAPGLAAGAARTACSRRPSPWATAANYRSAGTFEFLVDADRAAPTPSPSSRPTRACRSSTRSPRR